MSFGKWLLSGLGWATMGPIGGLLGYLIGKSIESISSRNQSDSSYSGFGDGMYNTHRGPFHNTGTQDDINVALIVLIAAVMKADGEVKRSELDYVKQFLLKNYGEEKGKQLLAILRDLVKPETSINIHEIGMQIKQNTDYTTRYHMVDFLFGLAVSDGSFMQSENGVLRSIARSLGINSNDFNSIYYRHVGSHQQNNNSYNNYSYSGYSRNSSYSHASSQSASDPYKVLGIEHSATDDEVKKAYRRMAMKYHPDKVEGMGEEVKKNAESQFRNINEAYEQIKKMRGMK
ncbi:MAG: TerB family tellurite resistance protein [Bacteroidales bacterium]|nr:TerB family tellurite resistance protein [Candidatus Colimorpha merdihippi]MCQ2281028.1 TerB family tellurite resistance protein [Bacteroidales bacterium]